MDKKLLTLKKQQRQATRINTQKELTKAEQFFAPDAAIERENIDVSIKKLEGYRTRLTELDQEILVSYDDQNVADAEFAKSFELDETLFEMIERLSARLRKLDLQPHSASSAANVSMSSERQQHSVKLPKLHIAHFNGDALKWQEFWDSFENSVHNNDELTAVEKFTYLKSFLKGDALRLVEGYRLTSVNYDAVIDTLKQRFGNTQVAVFAHFEAMLAIPVASHELSQLQAVYDECEKHIRSLVALGLAEETFGQVFTPIMLSKLPKFVKIEIHRRNSSEPWTLAKLRELLKDEIHARDMSQRAFGGGSSSGPPEMERKNNGKAKPERPLLDKKPPRSFSTTASLVSTEKKPNCSYCGSSHFSDKCQKFSDVQSRRRQLNDRCLSCLASGHQMRDCQKRNKCFYCGKEGHHRSLCVKKFGSNSKLSTRNTNVSLHVDGTNVNGPSTVLETGTSSLLSHGEKTMMQTAVTDVTGKTGSRSARLLMDTGCSRSFVTERLCKQIGARYKGEEVVSIAGFGDTRRKSITYKIYEFDVALKNGGHITLTANAIDVITCPVQIAPIDADKNSVVKFIPLAEPLTTELKTVEVDILVGGDYYYEFVGSEQIRCSGGLILLSSSLGYIAAGRLETEKRCNDDATSLLLTRSDPLPESNFNLERFWRLEDIGILDKQHSEADDVALQFFNDTVRFEDNRYSVKWPWKPGPPNLADNSELSKGRLKSLMKRLSPQPEVLKKYDQTIRDQIESGVVERAPSVPDGSVTYYIPHHHVVTPHKATTKLRIVYDASSKTSKAEHSLNECIYRGPVMLADLCGLLLRFRVHRVALVSDIEKAFLQVELQKPDRDVTRFFWLKDASAPLTDSNIVAYRFRRVPFGVIASPFLLAATVAHHLSRSDSPVAKEIVDNMYVDNVIAGKDNASDAVEFYAEAKALFQTASMNLREWFCNDPEVLTNIPEKDRGSGDSTKVLGIRWNVKVDSLSCSIGKFDPKFVRTKRQFMKALASVFDPCGFFAPVVIVGKILLQEIWKHKYEWDAALPDDILNQVIRFLTDLQQVPTFSLPRQYFSGSTNEAKFELHCFVDASAKAYCAVVYLRSEIGGFVTTRLVFSKSRVSPLKELTVPKLELMAILVGTKTLAFVEAQLRLPIANKTLWSDSQCALHWVLGKDVTTIFVRNRVKQIREYVGVRFRYVPTDDNPADHPTRGLSFAVLIDTSSWWHGPPWLQLSNDRWPETDKLTRSVPPIDPVDSEAILTGAEATPNAVYLVEPSRFSSLSKLLRVTAWVLRFIHNCRNRPRRNGSLTSTEIIDSRLYWDQAAQQTLLTEVLSNKPPAFVKQLRVRVGDDNLIRCFGRYEYADVDDSAKNPILLPNRDHWYTKLVIQECHSRLAHAGVKHTLAQLRLRYWIISGRCEIKRVINDCRVCRRVVGGSFRTPKEPPLPEFRASYRNRPFACVGVDYLGPLYIRDGESQRKVWICLFTCSVVRAVHLEVVEELSAPHFALCLRRFMAIYGAPQLIVSDNAKQFHAVNKLLSKLWKQICHSEAVQNLSTDRGVEWKFVTEKAPWMGGFYERMIGVVKVALKKTLDRRRLLLSELQTVVLEIASIVNSRPLVYQEDNVNDSALTPAHFLMRHRETFPGVPENEPEFVPRKAGTDFLVCYWKRIQALLNSFWKMWRNQYLLSLREVWRTKRQRGSSELTPQVGSVVLIKDGSPRAQWRIGRIVRLVISRDGACRSANVRLASGNVLCRPVKLLFPIENENADVIDANVRANTVSRHENDKDPPRRSRRTAAIIARERIARAVESSCESEPDL